MGRLRRAMCSECKQDLKGGKCRGVGEAEESQGKGETVTKRCFWPLVALLTCTEGWCRGHRLWSGRGEFGEIAWLSFRLDTHTVSGRQGEREVLFMNGQKSGR